MLRLDHPAGLPVHHVLLQRARGRGHDRLAEEIGRRDEGRLSGAHIGQDQQPAAAEEGHRLLVIDQVDR